MPGVYDIEHYKGDGFKQKRFSFYEDSANTVPLDLSGYSAIMQVRRSGKSNDVILEWTTDPASGEDATISITGSDNNQLNILSRTGSEMNIDAGNYVYDIQLTSGAGVVTTYIYGAFKVIQDITRV